MPTLNPMELLGKWLGRDDYVEAPVVTEAEAYIERGDAWHYSGVASGTAAGGWVQHACYVNSATLEMDLLYAVTANEHVILEVYESPTFTTTGTAATAVRLNRAVGDVPEVTGGLLIWADPVPALLGNLLSREFIPVGVSMPGRGHVVPGGKWCLKPLTWYLFRVLNTSSNKAFISGMAEWWERDSIWAEKNEIP
jgi:hypothetical protein